MMVRKSDGAFEQSAPSNTWSFTIPEGRMNVELIGVFSADGRTAIPFDSSEFTGGVMTIFFGIDAVTGTARYEYDIESDGGSTVVGSGGVIHVHQYNYPR